MFGQTWLANPRTCFSLASKEDFPRAPAILSGWTMLNLHLSHSHPMKSLWNPMKSPWNPCHRHGDMSRSCRFSGTALRQCCSTSWRKQSRPVGAGISSRDQQMTIVTYSYRLLYSDCSKYIHIYIYMYSESSSTDSIVIIVLQIK